MRARRSTQPVDCSSCGQDCCDQAQCWEFEHGYSSRGPYRDSKGAVHTPTPPPPWGPRQRVPREDR